MPTVKKAEIVDELTEKFKNASALYLADFKGMDMEITTELRKKFSSHNIEYKVVKNTLSKIALKNAGIEGLDEHFKGVTAIAIAVDDPAKPAKVISAFNKDSEGDGLKLKACLFEGVLYGPDRVDQLADLPSREELIATFAMMLNAPMTKLAMTLRAPAQKLAATLKGLEQSK